MIKLLLQALATFVGGALLLGLLLFLPAGTFNYWQAWVLIGVFCASTTTIGVYLTMKDPALLERRKQVAPSRAQGMVQNIIISIAVLSMLALPIFCGFDHRLGWSLVPPAIAVLGDVLVALGLLINLVVLRENSYGGSSIQTFAGQQVISTGLYARVRHPMYVGVLILVAGIPLALGSWWGLWILALTIPGLVLRILDEEKLLETELPGYKAYEQKVRYRLVPYLW
jgi:protein-S-isoprenylcysteine O-methyltransferase Ste14